MTDDGSRMDWHPHPMAGMDAFSPAQIARRVERQGVAKASAPVLTTLVLGVLAGAFIALGGLFATTVGTGSDLGFGPTRLLVGMAFSLGLILVVVAGAELFTGNNLVVMSWVSGKIPLGRLLRNWGIVYLGNLAGALSIVCMAYGSGWWRLDGGRVGAAVVSAAGAKVSLPLVEAFFRAVLANALVCLAVWLATAARSVVGKVVAVLFPITAFVAAGFEHCVANMYYIPLGYLLAGRQEVLALSSLTAAQVEGLDLAGFLHNLLATTTGNVLGGGFLVGLVYWFIYLRGDAGKDGSP